MDGWDPFLQNWREHCVALLSVKFVSAGAEDLLCHQLTTTCKPQEPTSQSYNAADDDDDREL